MPVILDDLENAPTHNVTVTPKFFSSVLTGNGKNSRGLINANILDTIEPFATPLASYTALRQGRTTHNGVITHTIPTDPFITPDIITELYAPDVATCFEIDHARVDDETWLFRMTPNAVVVHENTNGPQKTRTVNIAYRMELYWYNDPDLAETFAVGTSVFVDRTDQPLRDAQAFIHKHVAMSNDDAFTTWLRDTYSTYDELVRCAHIWSSHELGDLMSLHIHETAATLHPAHKRETLNKLAHQLHFLETYTVSLESYQKIFETLKASFDDTITTALVAQNINLVMAHTLDQLKTEKNQLITPQAPQTPPALPAWLSQQQRAAVTTHEPLAITQAGAGTGKSTVIVERIKYLHDCQVKPEDITVISFTNAAADNIRQRYPHVGSMTIAKLIVDIYAQSYPSHQTSSTESVVNAIEIYCHHSPIADKFCERLINVERKRIGALTMLNNFVEHHFDEVINILHTIKQTTLELQLIVCFQKIATMSLPNHVQSKYLIIDEVQDTSVFEFIFILKYVAQYQQSLYIVGDASQTLYEFRFAHPKALNMLEASGVFATYQLTTNYRSNQEILDFANVTLGKLETNQFARLQLQANSFAQPTADSFQHAVTVKYSEVQRMQDFTSSQFRAVMRRFVDPDFIRQCRQAGEKIAFLAYSRSEVELIGRVLRELYPTEEPVSLVSDKFYASDVFSQYVKRFWNDVTQVQPADASFAFTQGVQTNLSQLVRKYSDKVEVAMTRQLSQWWIENQSTINADVRTVQAGGLSTHDFFERLRENILSFEVRLNQKRLNLNSARNEERKQRNLDSTSPFIISTIHGAKGLEFDNVVVLYKESPDMTEATKRMFYVAFTRAMKREYILAYGTKRRSEIAAAYDALVAECEKADAQRVIQTADSDADGDTTSPDDAPDHTGAETALSTQP